MKLEAREDFGLFSSTEIPDIFFSEYLSLASGDAVKVYLYLSFLSKTGKEVNVNDIAKFLSLSYESVNSAIKYWEEQGLLLKKPDGYIFANLKEIALSKFYSPKIASDAEAIKRSENNKTRTICIESINNQFFSGTMNPTWYTEIDLWFKKYGFDEQVMLSLFSYCSEKTDKLNRNYMQAVADGWAKSKIKTFEDLDNYFSEQEKINTLKKEIANKLGLYKLTTFEDQYILKWTDEYGYGMDIIELALKRSVLKANAGFKYYDEIISDWHVKGLKTPEQVETYLNSVSEKKVRTKKVQSMAKQFEYTQSTFESFENLYDN